MRLTLRGAVDVGPTCETRTSDFFRWEAQQWDTDFVPTVLRSGPYRVYFHSHEPNEPPHVHVDRDDQSAKFWLKPIALVHNLGFSPVELRGIQRILKENESSLLEKWNARFRS